MIDPFISPKKKKSSSILHYIKFPIQSLKGSINSIKERESLEYISNNPILSGFNVPKNINNLSEIESLSENISILNSFFFSNYHDREKIENFKKKYQYYLNGSYLDVLLVMKEFPEYSILDFINLNIEFNLNDLSEQKKREQKLMIITRNNIILKLLVIATDIHFKELEGEINFSKIDENENKKKSKKKNFDNNEEDLLFGDLSFLQNTIEQFKSLIVENDNILNIEYDVEVLFLALLGYKEKARIIKQKHNDYFKNFISECDIIDGYNFDEFLSVTVEKKTFDSLTLSEILIFRKILNNSARRKFYYGFEFIMKNIEFCFILSEGRIWKNLGKKLTEEQVYNLWGIYEENLSEIKNVDLKETIGYEYKNKINSLKGEKKLYQFFKDNNRGKFMDNNNTNPTEKEANYNFIMGRLNHNLEKLIDEINLYFVTSLKDLLLIFFKCNLKELVMFFFDQYKTDRKSLYIPLEIYEITLEYDEDIAIDIMGRALNINNVKASYMGICLIKRYFKLARELLKFRKCKDYLNSPPPDTDEYIGLMSKLQVNSKFKDIDEITFKHPKDEIKIFDFLKKVSSINSNDETVSEGTTTLNNIEEDSLSTNTKIENLKKLNKNSTFNRIKKNTIMEKENSLIKIPNKNLPSNISDYIFGISSVSKKRKNYKYHRGSISYQIKFPLYNDSSEMNFLDSQNENFSSLNKIKINDSFLENPKQKESDISKKISLIKVNTNKNSKKRNSIISPKKQKALSKNNLLIVNKARERRKSFFIPPPNENSTPTGKLSIISNHVEVEDKNSNYNKTNIFIESESEESSKSESEEKKRNIEEKKIILNDEISIQTNIINEKKEMKSDKINKRKNIEKNMIKKFKKGKIKINVQLVLIDELRKGEFACDALCLLSSIEEGSLNLNYSPKIFSYILVFTSHEETITKCREPLLFIALAAEFLLKIGNLNKKILFKAQAVAEEILELGEKIQTSIQDEDMLNFYLKEQYDHKNRNAIEIYAENKFFNLLRNSNVGGIVSKLWYGSGHEFSIFKFLRMTRLIRTNVMFENFNIVVSNNYFPSDSLFTFQFNSYKHNCSTRYIFDNFTFVAITFYYQYIVYMIPSYNGENHYILSKHEYIANGLLVTYFINFIFLNLYAYKTGRTRKFEKLEIISIIIMMICVFLLLIDFPTLISENHKKTLQKEHEMVEGIIASLLLLMSWIKVFCIFMETSTYGPFLRIMIGVFSHVFFFMLIVICITFLFAQIFTIFFQHSNPNFNLFYNGFITLFGTAFGQVEFDDFSNLNVFGYICLMMFTTLSNIMLFNLIVGIINNLFENATEVADAESRAMLILTYNKLRWDEKYGLFIFLPSPLNLFSLPFNLFLLFFGEKIRNIEIISQKLCKLFYFFILIIYFLFLFIIGIISFPFALIKSYYHISFDFFLKKIYNDSGILQNKYYKQLIVSYFFLPFQLLFFFFVDLLNFWKLCYKQKNHSYDTKEYIFLTKDYISELRKVFCELKFKEKKKVVTLYELYEKLHLFKKSRKTKILVSNKNSASENDNSINNNSEENNLSELNSSTDNKRKSVFFLFNTNNKNILDKRLLKEALKNNFRILLDKLVDTEGFIDLERALIILPYKVIYSENFLKSLKYLNVKVIIRGIRKFLFKIEGNNSKYAFKKMQLLIYKIMLKFNLMYYYLSDETIMKIKEISKNVNSHPQFGKNGIISQMFEKRDDESEYDDEGEGITSFERYSHKKYISPFETKFSGNLSNNSNQSNSKDSK